MRNVSVLAIPCAVTFMNVIAPAFQPSWPFIRAAILVAGPFSGPDGLFVAGPLASIAIAFGESVPPAVVFFLSCALFLLTSLNILLAYRLVLSRFNLHGGIISDFVVTLLVSFSVWALVNIYLTPEIINHMSPHIDIHTYGEGSS